MTPGFIEEFEVIQKRDGRTGRWSTKCPSCPRAIEAQTEHGLGEALCDHMNDWHPHAGARRDS